VIDHWNGTSWSSVPPAKDTTGPEDQLYAVAALSATNIWAVGVHFDAFIGGYDGLIEQWNGTAWSIVPSPNPAPNTYNQLLGITALSSTDAWAVGYDYQNDATNIAAHWNGSQWTSVPTPVPSGSHYHELFAVASVSPGTVLAVGRTDQATSALITTNG
jgi:hypothetical protein